MAFPTGWLRKCALVIQNGKIDDTLSNFPVLITETTLPQGNDEIFDADGSHPAQTGGGDIRFSSDSAGSSQLACEIVTFTTDNDPANGKAEIWVEVPSIASGTDTTIYIWWETSGSDSQPAEDAAYGKEDTWDDGGNDYFQMVQHLNEDPTPDGAQAIDSTQYDIDGTSAGTMDSNDLVTGAFASGTQGKGWDFDGGDDYVGMGDNLEFVYDASQTVSLWIKTTQTNTYAALIGKSDIDSPYNGWVFTIDGSGANKLAFEYVILVGDVNHLQKIWQNITYADGNWHHLSVVKGDETAANLKLYVDGTEHTDVDETVDTLSSSASTNISLQGAARDGANWEYDGVLDEIHISYAIRAVAWINAEWENGNDPNAFIVEGTPEATAVAVSPTATLYGPLVGALGGPV